MVTHIQSLESLIKEHLKPGWSVRLFQSSHTSSVSIIFHNKMNNMSQRVEIADEFILNIGVMSVMDYLSTSVSCTILTPTYQKIFDHLMRNILWQEFTPGKLWD